MNTNLIFPNKKKKKKKKKKQVLGNVSEVNYGRKNKY